MQSARGGGGAQEGDEKESREKTKKSIDHVHKITENEDEKN